MSGHTITENYGLSKIKLHGFATADAIIKLKRKQ